MNTAVLLSGSNLGDRFQNLATAKQLLKTEDCILIKESSVYISAAWGNTGQAPFLNQALSMSTKKDPRELLRFLLKIEQSMGRRRKVKWEPRLIDLDILFFNDLVYQTDELTIPHPHLHERKFALMPVAEILPDWMHPVLQKTVSSLLREVNDPLSVKKFESA